MSSENLLKKRFAKIKAQAAEIGRLLDENKKLKISLSELRKAASNGVAGKEKEILDGAPDGVTEYKTYQDADGEKVIYGCLMNGFKLDDLRKRVEEKPRTKTEWVKVTDSIFHLKPDLDAGELYLKEWENRDEYTIIDNEDALMDAMTADSVCRKVETEITWQDKAKEFFTAYSKSDLKGFIDFSNSNGLTIMQSDFVKLCHLVSSMNK